MNNFIFHIIKKKYKHFYLSKDIYFFLLNWNYLFVKHVIYSIRFDSIDSSFAFIFPAFLRNPITNNKVCSMAHHYVHYNYELSIS